MAKPLEETIATEPPPAPGSAPVDGPEPYASLDDPAPDAAQPSAEAAASPSELTKPRAMTWRDVLKPLASLRVTVVLFVLCFFLVFAGTLAQVDYGIWTVMAKVFRTTIAIIELRWFFPRDWDITFRFPFPGGYLLGGALLINLMAAHAIRFKMRARGGRVMGGLGLTVVGTVTSVWYYQGVVTGSSLAEAGLIIGFLVGVLAHGPLFAGIGMLFEKRSGIVLIHGGIILMLVGELITALYAVEGNMRIDEGRTSNFVEDIREVELSFISADPTDPGKQRDAFVPLSVLQAGGRISHPELPVDIEVDRFFVNSSLMLQTEAEPEDLRRFAFPVPSVGNTLRLEVPIEQAEVSGADPEQTVDAPAAVVQFFDKKTGESMGEHMLSLWQSNLDQPVTIDVAGVSYDVYLRFKRTYKPYQLLLKDFKHERTPGMPDMPRNFESVVQLSDPETGENREVRIWMNHPLRYRGETFFQSAFEPGDETTILQVVKNPGALLPYMSCVLVACGMLAHFGLHLRGFLDKQERS